MKNRQRGGLFLMFFTMLKIGLFTFGGGYAMIALLKSEAVNKRDWLDGDEFLDLCGRAGDRIVLIKRQAEESAHLRSASP